MTEQPTRKSRRKSHSKSKVTQVIEEMVVVEEKIEEFPEIVFTPDPELELDFVFTPDPEIEALFEAEIEPEPMPEPKAAKKEEDPDMRGLTQTKFGRGKQLWRRRTRRMKDG